MKDYWGWAGPLVLAFLIGFAQIYALFDRVNKLEVVINGLNVKARERLVDVEYRLKNVEKYCCEETIK